MQKSYFCWFRVFIVIIFLFGIYFRFINIDRKLYWHDEIITSVRVAGYTKGNFSDILNQSGIISGENLQQYLSIDSNTNFISTINSLATENPEHVPIYFVLLRWWVKLFGDSIAVTRSFSAVVSLLVFPCIYWLCRELFNDSLVGEIAIALTAVSPILVLYAQEARAYSLYAVTVLFSSIALFRAMEIQSKRSWLTYTASLVLNLYTNLFFLSIVMGHGLYVVLVEKLRLTKRLKAYLLASAAGFLIFLPWIIAIVNDYEDTAFISQTTPFLTLLKRWFINLGFTFLDIQIGSSERLFDIRNIFDNDALLSLKTIWPYLLGLILVLIIYSVYFVCRHRPKEVSMLILTLILVTPVNMGISDLISGGQRSSIARYLIPSYLGIHLCIAYLLTNKLTNFTHQFQHKFWQIVTVCLISAGIISCIISSQAETWWHKYSSYYNPQVAKIINQTDRPLVISNHSLRLASLSYLLNPQVKFQLVEAEADALPEIPDNFTDLFIFYPENSLISELETQANSQLKLIHDLGQLWVLKEKEK